MISIKIILYMFYQESEDGLMKMLILISIEVIYNKKRYSNRCVRQNEAEMTSAEINHYLLS